MIYIYIAYNRLESVKISFDKMANILMNDDELYIICDGHKNEHDKTRVESVRNKISEIVNDKLKNIAINLIFRNNNYGLQKNIVEGVYNVLKNSKQEYFTVIEDDVVVGDGFKELLVTFQTKNDENVGTFSGWFWPINTNNLNNSDFYFQSTFVSCWGWGAKRLLFISFVEEFMANRKSILKLNWSEFKTITFGLNTTRFSLQIIKNKFNFQKTWAIYWYVYNLKKGKKCLYSSVNTVENVGIFSGSNYNDKGDRLIVNSEKIKKENIIYNTPEKYLNEYFAKFDNRFSKIINIILYFINRLK